MCDFGRDLGLDPEDFGKLCRHPEVAGRRKVVATEDQRCKGGACGPEAKWLTIKGLQL